MKTLIYLGTPEISANCLEQILELKDFKVIGVISQPDKPRGRQKEPQPSPVSEVAIRHNIPLHRPVKLNKDYRFIEELKPDLLLTFAYGQIIAEKVLALSKYQALNLHASLLPAYRGAAPIQYALRNGDAETGVSLMAMVKAMDAGAVYAVERVLIAPEDNYSSLAKKISDLSFQVAAHYLPLFFAGELKPQEQDESLVTLAPSIKKEEERLSLQQSAKSFVDQVRSLSLVPGGYLYLDKEMVKILEAKIYSSEVLAPLGTVIRAKKSELLLQLADGVVNITLLQKAGKKIMDTTSFNNGFKIEGKRFE